MDNPEKLVTWGTQEQDKQNPNTTQYVFINNVYTLPYYYVGMCIGTLGGVFPSLV